MTSRSSMSRAENNWSLVRVWYEPAHALGRRLYPAYGFILPN